MSSQSITVYTVPSGFSRRLINTLVAGYLGGMVYAAMMEVVGAPRKTHWYTQALNVMFWPLMLIGRHVKAHEIGKVRDALRKGDRNVLKDYNAKCDSKWDKYVAHPLQCYIKGLTGFDHISAILDKVDTVKNADHEAWKNNVINGACEGVY